MMEYAHQLKRLAKLFSEFGVFELNWYGVLGNRSEVKVSILRRSKTKLSLLVLVALLFAGAASAESVGNAGKKVTDPAASHAAGPDKTSTPESGGVPYAASPETAAPGVSPKIPAGTSPIPAKGTSPDGTNTIKVPASDSPKPSDANSGDPEIPGTALPTEDGLTVPTNPGAVIPQLQSMPVPGDANAHKAPASNGKPQIGLQFPSHNQLGPLLRIDPLAARAWIRSAEATCRKQLVAAGMDPNISVDDAMALSKPVINIYLKRSVGDNIMAHGFSIQAFLVQYRKKPSGFVETVRSARIGESPEVYSGSDFIKKSSMLVDVYISARHHQLRAAAAAQKGKPAAKGKKTK